MNTATGFRQGNLPGKVPDHTHNAEMSGAVGFFTRIRSIDWLATDFCMA
jgi:hypothetical protein